MHKLTDALVLNVFISCGVILGGSLLGALGAVFTGQPPGHSLTELAGKLKIWALVAALGGTFDAIKALEEGVLGWQPGNIAKQFLQIFAAFAGAQAGYVIITHLAGNGR